MCAEPLFLTGLCLGFVAVWLGGVSVVRRQFMLTRRKTLTGQPAVVAGCVCVAVAAALVTAILVTAARYPAGMGH
ncbi:MAG: hypothetical protein U0746_04875 [Gemmataceae bacterium]